jgi:hypothetical protein
MIYDITFHINTIQEINKIKRKDGNGWNMQRHINVYQRIEPITSTQNTVPTHWLWLTEHVASSDNNQPLTPATEIDLPVSSLP